MRQKEIRARTIKGQSNEAACHSAYPNGHHSNAKRIKRTSSKTLRQILKKEDRKMPDNPQTDGMIFMQSYKGFDIFKSFGHYLVSEGNDYIQQPFYSIKD